MEREQLLERLDRSWRALIDSYAGLPATDLLKPGVAGEWSVRDIVAHVTWWEQEALLHLPLILSGGRPPRYSVVYGGLDAFNALMRDRRKSLSLPEVLRERDETHHKLVDFLRDVPDQHLAGETRFVRRLRLDTYGHYRLHAATIREWRARLQTSAKQADPG